MEFRSSTRDVELVYASFDIASAQSGPRLPTQVFRLHSAARRDPPFPSLVLQPDEEPFVESLRGSHHDDCLAGQPFRYPGEGLATGAYRHRNQDELCAMLLEPVLGRSEAELSVADNFVIQVSQVC